MLCHLFWPSGKCSGLINKWLSLGFSFSLRNKWSPLCSDPKLDPILSVAPVRRIQDRCAPSLWTQTQVMKHLGKKNMPYMHPWDEFLVYLPSWKPIKTSAITWIRKYTMPSSHGAASYGHGGRTFVMLFAAWFLGKVLGPSWRKKKEYPHLSIGNTSSYIFMHGIHGSFYQAAMLDLPGCIWPQIWWAVSLLSLDPLASEKAQAPTVRLHRPISCVPVGVWSAPYDTFWLDTYTSLVN